MCNCCPFISTHLRQWNIWVLTGSTVQCILSRVIVLNSLFHTKAALWNIPASTYCWWGRASSILMTTIICICLSCDFSCSVLDERLFPVRIFRLDCTFCSWSHIYRNTLKDATNQFIKQPTGNMRSIPVSSWFVSDGFFTKSLVWKSMLIS